MGRTLAPDDNRPGGEPGVAVVSYNFWKRRLAGDPAVLGASLVIKQQNGHDRRRGAFGILRGVGRTCARYLGAARHAAALRPRHVAARASQRRLAARRGPSASWSNREHGRRGARGYAERHSVRSDGFQQVRPAHHRAIVRRQPWPAGLPGTVLAASTDSRGHRRDRASHRLRERGEPPAGAGDGPTAGDGGAPGDRCRTRPPGPSAVHGEPAAGGARRRPRSALRLVGQPRAARARLERRRADPHRRGPQRARPRVHFGALARDRRVVRSRACADGVASRRRNRVEADTAALRRGPGCRGPCWSRRSRFHWCS